MAKKMKADNAESPVSGTKDPAESSSSLTDQVSTMVDSAKQAGAQAFTQAKDQATSRADQGRQTLASGVQAVAQAFQTLGNDLSKQDQPVAKYAAEMGQAIGGQVEQLAHYLQDRDMRTLIADTEGFARRSPAVFLGSAFVLGLAASRFLKSSRPSQSGTAAPAPPASPGTPGPQLALPPASTPAPSAPPSSGVDASMPSGFPFDSPRTTPVTATSTVNPSTKSTGTDPFNS